MTLESLIAFRTHITAFRRLADNRDANDKYVFTPVMRKLTTDIASVCLRLYQIKLDKINAISSIVPGFGAAAPGFGAIAPAAAPAAAVAAATPQYTRPFKDIQLNITYTGIKENQQDMDADLRKKIDEILFPKYDQDEDEAEEEKKKYQLNYTSRMDTIAKLLRAGADPDCYAINDSFTSLRWAVKQKNQDLIELLAQHGASVYKKNVFQPYLSSAYEVAQKEGTDDIKRFLDSMHSKWERFYDTQCKPSNMVFTQHMIDFVKTKKPIFEWILKNILVDRSTSPDVHELHALTRLCLITCAVEMARQDVNTLFQIPHRFIGVPSLMFQAIFDGDRTLLHFLLEKKADYWSAQKINVVMLGLNHLFDKSQRNSITPLDFAMRLYDASNELVKMIKEAVNKHMQEEEKKRQQQIKEANDHEAYLERQRLRKIEEDKEHAAFMERIHEKERLRKIKETEEYNAFLERDRLRNVKEMEEHNAFLERDRLRKIKEMEEHNAFLERDRLRRIQEDKDHAAFMERINEKERLKKNQADKDYAELMERVRLKELEDERKVAEIWERIREQNRVTELNNENETQVAYAAPILTIQYTGLKTDQPQTDLRMKELLNKLFILKQDIAEELMTSIQTELNNGAYPDILIGPSKDDDDDDKNMHTGLFFAVKQKNQTLIQVFLQHGANMHTISDEIGSQSPYAAAGSDPVLQNYMRQYYDLWTEYYTSESRFEKLITTVESENYKANVRLNKFYTDFMDALEQLKVAGIHKDYTPELNALMRLQVFAYLIHVKHVDVEIPLQSDSFTVSRTPTLFMQAVLDNDQSLVRFLIKKGANVLAKQEIDPDIVHIPGVYDTLVVTPLEFARKIFLKHDHPMVTLVSSATLSPLATLSPMATKSPSSS